MPSKKAEECKRPYELGKRLEQMDQTRAAVLRAARVQLEAKGYRKLTMESLAAESGVTRQTIHNLFGTKAAVLEALFDAIALEAGMQGMREVMTQTSGEAMLEGFVQVFCRFWTSDRLLHRRIHGICAVDPELGAVVEARNQRRRGAAQRVVSRMGVQQDAGERAAALAALTSFEFFDALVENGVDEERAARVVLEMARELLRPQLKPAR